MSVGAIVAPISSEPSGGAFGAGKRRTGCDRADFKWRKHSDGWALNCTGQGGALLHVIQDTTYREMWRIRLADGRLSDMANLTWARDGAIKIALILKSLVGDRYFYQLCTMAMSDLNAAKALIFRILHRDNVPWMLDHGLHCRNSQTVDPNYVSIGNPELIARRHLKLVQVPPGGTLSDYVPFYFTPSSPMLYNIKTGWAGIVKRANDEIAIVVSSLHTLKAKGVPFLFTDRHAYLNAALYSSDLGDLNRIDWPLLQRRDFKRDGNDLDKGERYQAEALVHRHLPMDAVLGIGCYSDSAASFIQQHIKKRDVKLRVVIRPQWYFS